ncbi:hypothetical protein COP1_014169 [Malus domestica]
MRTSNSSASNPVSPLVFLPSDMVELCLRKVTEKRMDVVDYWTQGRAIISMAVPGGNGNKRIPFQHNPRLMLMDLFEEQESTSRDKKLHMQHRRRKLDSRRERSNKITMAVFEDYPQSSTVC